LKRLCSGIAADHPTDSIETVGDIVGATAADVSGYMMSDPFAPKYRPQDMPLFERRPHIIHTSFGGLIPKLCFFLLLWYFVLIMFSIYRIIYKDGAISWRHGT
jgi:hypothetical protein